MPATVEGSRGGKEVELKHNKCSRKTKLKQMKCYESQITDPNCGGAGGAGKTPRKTCNKSDSEVPQDKGIDSIMDKETKSRDVT